MVQIPPYHGPFQATNGYCTPLDLPLVKLSFFSLGQLEFLTLWQYWSRYGYMIPIRSDSFPGQTVLSSRAAYGGAHSCVWRRRFYNRGEWGSMCKEKQRRAVLRNWEGCVFENPLPVRSPWPLKFFLNYVDSPQKPSWHRASTTHPFLSRP